MKLNRSFVGWFSLGLVLLAKYYKVNISRKNIKRYIIKECSDGQNNGIVNCILYFHLIETSILDFVIDISSFSS